MTRQEFIERHRHEIGGMVLDAATAGLHGEALSVFVRGIMRKTDLLLGRMHDELRPPEPLPAKAPARPANGVAAKN